MTTRPTTTHTIRTRSLAPVTSVALVGYVATWDNAVRRMRSLTQGQGGRRSVEIHPIANGRIVLEVRDR